MYSDKDLHPLKKSLQENFDKNNYGNCYSCGVNGKYVDSHSVQESILRKMSYKGEVKVIQKWDLTFKIRLSNVKKKEISTNVPPSQAGVFHLLCQVCEKEDTYERKLLRNIYSHLNDQDYKDIYLKSLYHSYYNIKIKEGILPFLEGVNKHRERIVNGYIVPENKRLNEELAIHNERKYILVYDSKNHRGNPIKFNFSALTNIPIDQSSITVFVLPDKYGFSRIILIAPNTPFFQRMKKSFLKSDKNIILRKIIFDLFREKPLGIVFYGNTDTTRLINYFYYFDTIADELRNILSDNETIKSEEFNNFYNSLMLSK